MYIQYVCIYICLWGETSISSPANFLTLTPYKNRNGL